MGILDDKVTVVTGAARGIGRATLEVFLEEGARVVATDIDGDALSRTVAATGSGPDQLVMVVGDVSVEADAEAMIEAATRTWDRLDCLVANAGVIPLSTIDQTTVQDWDHVMAVDGRGMFLTCRAAIRVMAEQGSGCIVTLSSISGLAGQAGQAAYGPAKFVATGLTKHLAVEWANRGIRVNAVAPGTIRTDAIDEILRSTSGRRYVTQMEAQHPMVAWAIRARWVRPSRSLLRTEPASSPVRCSPWTVGTWLSEPRVMGRRAGPLGSYPRRSCAHPWFGSVADSGALVVRRPYSQVASLCGWPRLAP